MASHLLEPGASRVALGDLNGDGRLDIVSANPDSNSLTILINTSLFPYSSPTFMGAQSIAVPGTPRFIALGDLDHDGQLDLVASTSTGVHVFLNRTRP